jgi:hypothetical protein
MANELKHKAVGTVLTQVEFEATDSHVFNSQATGDIVIAGSSSQLERLGIGSTNNILTVTAGEPAWTATPTLTTVDATTDFTVGTTVITDDVITFTPTTNDTVTLTAATNGAFSLVTVDTAAAAANVQITADGTVDIDSTGALTLDSGAAINIEPAAGSVILLDGVLTIDAGVVAPVATAHDTAGTAISLSGGDTTAGTTNNIAGGALTIQGGQGKGSGAGGDIIFQTANAGGSGSSINALATALTISDNLGSTFSGTVTVGVDDTGHDVKLFGASAGAYLEWLQSADQLRIMGASADATTSTGKLLLATSLTDINANDVIGKIDFQAPHEGGGGDSTTILASIQAIAQGTFSSSVNATDLIFYTGHSEAATEKFRFTSQGEIGVGGANYGNDGQVLTSGGAGAAAAWEDTAVAATNLAINGAMNVAQRSVSVTGLGDDDEGYVTIDRFRETGSAASAGRYTSAQTAITDLPGFANSLHLDCTTADGSIAAGEFLKIEQRFEGQDLQLLKKGTASAESITVSFYMKTNKVFVFMCELNDSDNSRVSTQQFTTTTSWTRHEITFAGDTSGVLDDDTALSLDVAIWIHAGATYTGGTYAADTWQSRSGGDDMRAVGIGSFYDNTANDIKMTGFCVNIGTTAIIFPHEKYSETLAKCQRYYYKINRLGETPLDIGAGLCTATTAANVFVGFPVELRAKPTALEQSGTATDYDVLKDAGIVIMSAVPTYARSSPTGASSTFTAASGLVAGDGTVGRIRASAGYLAWSAEL